MPRDTTLRDRIFEELCQCDLICIVFGSLSSQDTDLIVVVPEHISIRQIPRDQLGDLCHMLEQHLQPRYAKPTNVNLCMIHNGVITAVHKGTIEETNNSVLKTYHLHPNTQPCPITQHLPLNLPQRLVRALRQILCYFDHGQKSDASMATRYRILCNLRDATLRTRGKKILQDVGKEIAFQIVQTTEMLQGREYYTKEDLAMALPDATALLYRGHWTRKNLDDLLHYAVDKIKLWLDAHPDMYQYQEQVFNNW